VRGKIMVVLQRISVLIIALAALVLFVCVCVHTEVLCSKTLLTVYGKKMVIGLIYLNFKQIKQLFLKFLKCL
jgi:hypothetical protein